MIEFLQSIRSDLFSRRLLPFVALLGIALIAAVAYAVKGGSGSSTSTTSASVPTAPLVSGSSSLPVSVAPTNPNEAVSETPGGVRFQSGGATRDPFVPLPSPPGTKTTTAASGASSSAAKSTPSSSGGSSSGSGKTGSSTGSTGGGGEKAPAPTPKKPSKPQFPYVVSILFGLASTTPGQPATLTPYPSLKLQQPLPSKQDERISFERVTSDAKGAVFKLVVPPILHGSGVCLPSTSECQTIDVQAGQTEELEYVEASGQIVLYELKVASIAKSGGASAARVKRDAKAALVKGRAKPALAIGSASSLRVIGR